jgi:hypothetical protein
MTTAAPASAPPWESVTTPTMELAFWADAGMPAHTSNKHDSKKGTIVRACLKPISLALTGAGQFHIVLRFFTIVAFPDLKWSWVAFY